MKKILDLGCGANRIENAIGMDKTKLKGVNVVHDAEKFPYPFKANYFDEVYCNHILEHLSDTVKTMEEIHRITKNDGSVFITVPHFSSKSAWIDPTHKKAFSLATFDYFAEKAKFAYYSKARYVVVKKRLKYAIRTDLPFIEKLFCAIIQFFADLNPYFCERIWLYWVGGFSLVEVELKVIK